MRPRLFSVPSRHPFYVAWYNMKERCIRTDKHNSHCYVNIDICERWKDFENFKEDMFSSWQEGLVLDRIDNNRGYSKENCRWTSYKKSGQNRRCCIGSEVAAEIRLRYSQEKVTQTFLAKQFGVSVSAVNRIVNGVTW